MLFCFWHVAHLFSVRQVLEHDQQLVASPPQRCQQVSLSVPPPHRMSCSCVGVFVFVLVFVVVTVVAACVILRPPSPSNGKRYVSALRQGGRRRRHRLSLLGDILAYQRVGYFFVSYEEPNFFCSC